MLQQYFLVGIGGACGAILRAFLADMLPATLGGIPLPILVINIIGCSLMGLVAGFMFSIIPISDLNRYFWVTGFLGGFTTFSAFAFDFGVLVEKEHITASIIYVISTIFCSLLGFIVVMRSVSLIIQNLRP
ncbi:fluoride efflux transporter FluC [Candidatus Odyssella thessalonicensis]|uniref:fluoride efflux transporter FluC n=1 Tax=Candidatus Odyssella thessalonicensis TaxID=84647 RepID=UPI000225ABEC|nr:CrcB family protein [Candidatus Odyssella thessalonicensis]